MGFSDTPSGRSEFDDFVMAADYDGIKSRDPWDDIESVTPADVRNESSDTEWRQLMRCVSQLTGLTEGSICRSQKREASDARLLAARMAHEEFGHQITAIASRLNRAGSTIYQLLARSSEAEPSTYATKREFVRRLYRKYVIT